MKNKTSGLIQLILSILVIVLFHLFFHRVISVVGLSHLSSSIVNFIQYLLISIIVFIIYKGNINAGKNRFNKNFFSNLIYCVSCFIFLVVVTILLHKGLNYVGANFGVSVPYTFTNYFSKKFTVDFIFNLITECIFLPFLLCVIFPLGFSNVFKGVGSASAISGITYGILIALQKSASFEYALFTSITPAVVVIVLTYLYRLNNNIWSVIVTYSIYVLLGIFALNTIL